MSLAHEFKNLLQNTFDLPFSIEESRCHGEPEFTVAPANADNSLLTITLKFVNISRLNLEITPQKFGAKMVRSMARAHEDKKILFCEYANHMTRMGAKITLKVNDSILSAHDYYNWPDHWESFDLRATVWPVSYTQSGMPDYRRNTLEWGVLVTGLALALLNIVPVRDDTSEILGYAEGRKSELSSFYYERNPLNRVLCIRKYGYNCQVCGFDFARIYGELGEGFIHVHHITPVSQIGENYIVNPINDLIPVCPNCHAMLHKKSPPLLPGELKDLLTTSYFESNSDSDMTIME